MDIQMNQQHHINNLTDTAKKLYQCEMEKIRIINRIKITRNIIAKAGNTLDDKLIDICDWEKWMDDWLKENFS